MRAVFLVHNLCLFPLQFAGDTESKQERTTQAMRAAANEFTTPLQAQLDALQFTSRATHASTSSQSSSSLAGDRESQGSDSGDAGKTCVLGSDMIWHGSKKTPVLTQICFLDVLTCTCMYSKARCVPLRRAPACLSLLGMALLSLRATLDAMPVHSARYFALCHA